MKNIVMPMDDDRACEEYYFKTKLKDKNFPYQDYCCLKMAYHLAISGNRDNVD